MARHRRQTKRRSYNKNRRTSRKMRGGVAETDRQILTGLGFTEQNINYLIENNPNMLIEFVQNSINPPPNNPFFTEAQTPAQFMADMMANNESFDNSVQNRTPSPNRRRFNPMSEENSDVSDYYEVTPRRINFNSDDSFGGKRKSKSNKRKMRKTRKVRKVRRNRRQQGGNTNGFTTQEETSPLAYLDQREISEANMPRP